MYKEYYLTYIGKLVVGDEVARRKEKMLKDWKNGIFLDKELDVFLVVQFSI